MRILCAVELRTLSAVGHCAGIIVSIVYLSTTATLRVLGFSFRCTGANVEFTCNGHMLGVLGACRTYECIGNGFYVIAASKQEKGISSN